MEKTIQNLAKEAVREACAVRGVNVSLSSIFIVWQCKTLQNWKAVAGSAALLGFLFEVTYDGNKDRTYVDVYEKVDNFMFGNFDTEAPVTVTP